MGIASDSGKSRQIETETGAKKSEPQIRILNRRITKCGIASLYLSMMNKIEETPSFDIRFS